LFPSWTLARKRTPRAALRTRSNVTSVFLNWPLGSERALGEIDWGRITYRWIGIDEPDSTAGNTPPIQFTESRFGSQALNAVELWPSIYIDMYIYTYMHIHICMYTYIHIHFFVYIHTYIYIHIYIIVYIQFNRSTYIYNICICIYMYIYLCMYTYIYIHIYIYIYYLCVYIHIRICIHICIHISISISIQTSLQTHAKIHKCTPTHPNTQTHVYTRIGISNIWSNI